MSAPTPDRERDLDVSLPAPGIYRGSHYTQWTVKVRRLLREARLDEAVALLNELIDAVESEDDLTGTGVAPWYYAQLALTHRRRRRLDEEIAVLERFAARPRTARSPGTPPLRRRLDQARVLRAMRDAG